MVKFDGLPLLSKTGTEFMPEELLIFIGTGKTCAQKLASAFILFHFCSLVCSWSFPSLLGLCRSYINRVIQLDGCLDTNNKLMLMPFCSWAPPLHPTPRQHFLTGAGCHDWLLSCPLLSERMLTSSFSCALKDWMDVLKWSEMRVFQNWDMKYSQSSYFDEI